MIFVRAGGALVLTCFWSRLATARSEAEREQEHQLDTEATCAEANATGFPVVLAEDDQGQIGETVQADRFVENKAEPTALTETDKRGKRKMYLDAEERATRRVTKDIAALAQPIAHDIPAGIVEQSQLCPTFWELTHSNLGGAGPDGGKETLTFAHGNAKLEVISTSPYSPNTLNPTGGVLRNGILRNSIGIVAINMASGSVNDFDISYDNQEPQLIPELFTFQEPQLIPKLFTFFLKGISGVIVVGCRSYNLTEPTSLVVSDPGYNRATFTNPEKGYGAPQDDNFLQQQYAVTLLCEERTVSITVESSGYAEPEGQLLLFSSYRVA